MAVRALGFQPRPDVQGIADQVRVVGPDHHLTGVHRDPQRQMHSVDLGHPAGQPDESLLQLDRGLDGVLGVVGPISGTPQTAMKPSPMYLMTPARWCSAVERSRSW